MGALADWGDLLAQRQSGRGIVPFNKITPTPVVGRANYMWLQQPLAGAAPTTAAAPTKATTGALMGSEAWPNSGGSLQAWIVGGQLAAGCAGTRVLLDVLSHQGGLSGIVTTAQTTNLPTAALTRYTSGVGVMLGLAIYTQIGATGTTVTASYTNQAGTTGRTTTAVVFGGTNFRELNRMILLPLQAGDTGVQAVASVTVLATTGTAGNFGVTLFKPLALIGSREADEALDPFVAGNMLGAPELVDAACLQFLELGQFATAGSLAGELLLAEV